MAADKYLAWDPTTHSKKEVPGTIVSAGAANGGELVALNEATGKLDETVMPTGIGSETEVCKAGSGGVTANDVVYIHMVLTVKTATKADATDHTKLAIGYVKDSISEGEDVTVYLDGLMPGSGLSPHSRYYLSSTPGLITTTPPSADGNVVQCIGRSVSETELKFEPEENPILIYNPV